MSAVFDPILWRLREWDEGSWPAPSAGVIVDIQQPDSRYPSLNNEYPSSTALKWQARRALDADVAGSVFFGIYDIAVALVDNPWLFTDADRAKIKWSDVNLSLYVPAFTTATNSNQVTVSDSNGSRSIHFTPVRIDASGNVTAVTQLSAQKFAVTVNESAPTTWFYYTDFIQNGLTGSSASTADMANLYSGMYWFSSGTQTKNAWWFGLSGNHIFVWQQWAGKVDWIQAVAWSVFVNNTRQVWDAATFRWFITNRGHIDSIAFFAGETNNYIWPAGTIDDLYAMHFKTGDLLNANATNTYGIVIEDDVFNYFGWPISAKKFNWQDSEYSSVADGDGLIQVNTFAWYYDALAPVTTSTEITTHTLWSSRGSSFDFGVSDWYAFTNTLSIFSNNGASEVNTVYVTRSQADTIDGTMEFVYWHYSSARTLDTGVINTFVMYWWDCKQVIGAWNITNAVWFFLPLGSFLNASNPYGIIIEDDVPNKFDGTVEARRITSNGLVKMPIDTVTANTTLDDTHYTLLVDATGWAVTITLPSLPSFEKAIYRVKKIDSSINTVTVTWAQTIDWLASVILLTQYQWIEIQGNSTERFIIWSL